MYDPAAFLISSTALTSIFSFFFGTYYAERQRAYELWLMFVAYGKEISQDQDKIDICAELESRDRMFFQARGFLGILLLTIALAYIVFQLYSFQYIFKSSPNYDPAAYSDYVWFNTIISFIVMINCLELLYIRVAICKSSSFPFVKLRQRVTGRDRLSKVWMLLECSQIKKRKYSSKQTPRAFYENQERYAQKKENEKPIIKP